MGFNQGQLRVADIIVSTTDHTVSEVIRASIGASVSHAMLIIGGGEVVEAIGEGVRRRPLRQALADATLAIALRRPNTTHEQRLAVKQHAIGFRGRPYDEVGAAGSGTTGRRGTAMAAAGCMILPRACSAAAAAVRANASPAMQDRAFFCSELVARAFELAGVPIIDAGSSPSFTNPRQIRMSSQLHYLGKILG